MSIRSRRVAPAHAPAWVRARHWPAGAAIVGMAAMAAALVAVHDAPRAPASPAQAAAAHPASTAAHAGAAAAQDAVAATTASSSQAPMLAGSAVAVVGPTDAASAQQLLGPAPEGRVAPSDAATVSGLATGGIPLTALEAYRRAATLELTLDPGCHLPWPLLAGIGRVESNHGRYDGAVLLSDGTSTKRILGIPLDGSRSATITDTDHGRLDGDTVYDRALGPMQFIPSTWASYGADGNGDGRKDPFNIFDAAEAAAHYLCVAGGNLSTLAGQTRAVLAYNHSSDYLALVLKLEHAYAVGVPGLVVPVLPAQSAPPSGAAGTPVSITPRPGHKPVPPVDPGPPLSAPSGPTTPHPVGSSTSRTSPKPRPTSTAKTSTSSAPSSSATSTPSPTSSAPSCEPTGTATSTDPSADPSASASGTTSSTPSSTTTTTTTAGDDAGSSGASSSGSSSASSSTVPICPSAVISAERGVPS